MTLKCCHSFSFGFAALMKILRWAEAAREHGVCSWEVGLRQPLSVLLQDRAVLTVSDCSAAICRVQSLLFVVVMWHLSLPNHLSRWTALDEVMLQVCFVLSRLISISCVLLASIYLFINGNSKSELSRGGRAELWNAESLESHRNHLWAGQQGNSPRPCGTIPTAVLRSQWFFKVGHLGAQFFKMDIESTILRKQKLLWEAETAAAHRNWSGLPF